MNVTKNNTFSRSADKKVYVINHSMKFINCNDECITYLLTFNDGNLQYVGKTVDDFPLLCNN